MDSWASLYIVYRRWWYKVAVSIHVSPMQPIRMVQALLWSHSSAEKNSLGLFDDEYFSFSINIYCV